VKSVAIVICNYNKKDFLLDCIASVFVSNFKEFDLIVVDNASTDGSVEAVRKQYSDWLTLLVNDENLGGSGGFNRGMTYAMDRGYKYIHLLDNDVVADKNAIGALHEFMEAHPEAGVCGSLIYRAQMKDRIQEFGVNIDLEHLSLTALFAGQTMNDDIPPSVACDYVAACSAMYRACALQKTGIIDKEYFVYCDDVALSLEMRVAGYKIYACSLSTVWHYGSYGTCSPFSRYYSFRNKIYLFTKYLDDVEYETFCNNLINMLFRMFAVNRENPDYIQNYFHALNDALNDVRGKAEDYKLTAPSSVDEKFVKTFANAKRILILYNDAVPDLDRVIDRIHGVTDAEICVYSESKGVPAVNGARYVNAVETGMYDRVVRLCYHILDEQSYDRSKVYIDKYDNRIMNDDDFDFYENYEIHRVFFNEVFHGFVKSKLDALRAWFAAREFEV
jgi:GT2 family glycosyltransferase